MMDGLLCKEVTLKRTKRETDYFRLEAEYYNSTSIKASNYYKGSDIEHEIQYGTSKRCDETLGGIPVLRLNELSDGFISTPQKYCHILSNEEYEKLRLNKGDVLIIRTNGNPSLVGKAAVVLENTEYAFASYLFRVIPNEKIDPEVLVTFLNCKYGRLEIDKNSIKGNQTNFSPAKFRDINIPVFGEKLRKIIKETVIKAYDEKCAANQLFAKAEKDLNESLQIQTENQLSPVVSEKFILESFRATGRLDAEYYQPKYESIEKALNTKETVDSLCDLHDDNYVPEQLKHYRYIELSDIGSFGEITDAEIYQGSDLPIRAKRKVKSGQVIVSSIEGSLQSCALITDEFDGAICSTGFYVIDSDKLTPETLLVLFKSYPIQELLKQRCSGTILTSINKEDFQVLPTPEIGIDIQNVITKKVNDSFSLRRKSKQLLDAAKRAVEIAIEQDEETAITWLKDRIDSQ